MKNLLFVTGLLLAGCSPSAGPAIPDTAAQVNALTQDFATWYRYTYARILLARDFQPRGVDGRKLPKKAFLQQLATGRVLALRNGFDHQQPVYQLCAYPGGHDLAIRTTSQQMAAEALRNYAWEGQRLPNFAWQDLSGVTYTPASTRGKVMVLKCWYTSCISCVDEFPAINALVERYRQQPQVLFVSLAMNEAKSLRTFLKDRAVKFAVVPTSRAYLTDSLGVFEYPTHFIIGQDGRIIKATNRASDLAIALAQQVSLARP